MYGLYILLRFKITNGGSEMYTMILYPDGRYEFLKELVTVKVPFPKGSRFFGIPPETTIEVLTEWVSLGFPAGDLIEY